MRVLLLNQYGPTSGAPTGRILGELGDWLQSKGHEIRFLETDAAYGLSRRGFGRILHELRVHFLLLVRSIGCAKVDAVISLTSPACMAVTATLIAALHRARHFHWTMDLYPEVGVRLGELRGRALPHLLSFLMGHAYRYAHQVIVLDEDMREHLCKKYGVDSCVIEPFPPEVEWPQVVATDSKRNWLYSGNFGRAHEIEALLQVQQLMEQRGVGASLVFQGHGGQFEASRDTARALNLSEIEWRSPISAEALGESLLRSDVLVVTRKPEMKGLLLPSKLMLAELSGRPILWIGDTEGYTSHRLRKAGHGVFAATDIVSIATWLQQVFEQPSRVRPPRLTNDARRRSLLVWEALLSA
jgi:colanic acid biosynthesis glycosyl transferase WcaI